MPINDPIYVELDIPNVPNWWMDGLKHDFHPFVGAHFRLVVTKQADGRLYVYVRLTDLPLPKPFDVEIPPPVKMPIPLRISWDEGGVRMVLGVPGRTTYHLWPDPPLIQQV